MSVPKKDRNKLIVEMRDKDPKKYSFGVLSSIFGINKVTIHEIYNREKSKNIQKTKKPAKKSKGI